MQLAPPIFLTEAHMCKQKCPPPSATPASLHIVYGSMPLTPLHMEPLALVYSLGVSTKATLGAGTISLLTQDRRSF